MKRVIYSTVFLITLFLSASCEPDELIEELEEETIIIDKYNDLMSPTEELFGAYHFLQDEEE